MGRTGKSNDCTAEIILRFGDPARLEECLHSMYKALGSSAAVHKTGMPMISALKREQWGQDSASKIKTRERKQ